MKPTAGLSIVPPRPKVEGKSRQAVNLKMHKYYIDNAPLIRADLEILKEKGVLERWLIPYQTWLRLRHVVAPEKYGPAPAPKVKKPQRSPPPRTAPPAAKAAASPPLQHTGAPVFPEFNPGWDPTVQCEWFQCYAVVFGPQGSKVGQ